MERCGVAFDIVELLNQGDHQRGGGVPPGS
jgi:hypothetical protein